MSTYVIGDIQGCFDAFQRLLEQLNFDASTDKLWLTGDLVNRGPDSLQTLRWIMTHQHAVTSVLGNHDLSLIACSLGAIKLKKKDTYQDILSAPDKPHLLEWLRQQPLLHYDEAHQAVMVHAGIPPQWSLQQARAYADEAARALRAPDYADFFDHMYGDTPNSWSNALSGYDRLRYIINAFTRMRFCTSQGTLQLQQKGHPKDAPEGYSPWFTHDSSKQINCKIFFGHWAAINGEKTVSHAYPLDTGCVWGGHLTAYCVESDTYTSVAAK